MPNTLFLTHMHLCTVHTHVGGEIEATEYNRRLCKKKSNNCSKSINYDVFWPELSFGETFTHTYTHAHTS